jgi:hypothetical protein
VNDVTEWIWTIQLRLKKRGGIVGPEVPAGSMGGGLKSRPILQALDLIQNADANPQC